MGRGYIRENTHKENNTVCLIRKRLDWENSIECICSSMQVMGDAYIKLKDGWIRRRWVGCAHKALVLN